MHYPRHEVRLERFKEALAAAGLKVTRQRLAVFKVVSGMKTHPSTEEVYRDLGKSSPSISFDTVNRTLISFAELGILSLVESYNGVRRFEADRIPHHHLHCLKCGKIYNYSCSDYDSLALPVEGTQGFRPTGARVSVFGYCTDCSPGADSP